MAETESQRRARIEWEAVHKDQKKRQVAKTNARRFVRDFAEPEEMQELVTLYNESNNSNFKLEP